MSRELPAEFTEGLSPAGPPRGKPLHEGAPGASYELFSAVLEGSEDGQLILDGGGTVVAINTVFADLCGSRAQDLVGRHWLSACTRIGTAFPFELVRLCLADGRPQRARASLPTPRGQERTLEVHVRVLAHKGRPLGRLLVQTRDITQLARIERQLMASERFTTNQHLAATVAHEVNTPLQAIESCLHLAGKLNDAEQRSRYLRLARDEIQRVGQILRQMLDLYRPSQGVSAPLRLNDLVERALLLVEASLTRRRIKVTTSLADGLPMLVGRADELTQVLLNLIMNAMQAMERGGQLSLSTRHERPEGQAPRLVLTVSDNGPGITNEALGRLFEPFFTTRAEGTGLGLAVSKRIVYAHGGTISVNSSPGEGACFKLVFPLAGGGGATPSST